MKYKVHNYIVVRVPHYVEADSQLEAIKLVEEYAYYGLFNDKEVDSPDWAEDSTGYLVDEEGDTDYDRSTFYDRDGVTVSNPKHCSYCGQDWPVEVTDEVK